MWKLLILSSRMLNSGVTELKPRPREKRPWKKARSKEFDLAVLDIFLPDTKGYDLIPRLKEVRPDMWFVTITGYNTRELELTVRQHRVAYFMTKPFEPFALKAVLDHMEKKRNASP